jgi:hypothetical protein
MMFDGDPGFEIFSDQTSLYVALPAASDPAPLLSRLREKQLFPGTWPTPAPPPQEPRGGEPPRPPRSDPRPRKRPERRGRRPGLEERPDPPQPSHRGVWIAVAAAIVLGVAVFALIGYTRMRDEIARAQEAATHADKARQEAERTHRIELARQAMETERLRVAAEAATADRSPDPVFISQGSHGGSFFVSMMRSNDSIERQKLIAFPSRIAALNYFQNDADWNRGRMVITSITTAAAELNARNEKVLVMLSDNGVTAWQQSYQNEDAFPRAWIEQKRREGFQVTTVSRVENTWWVVASKNTEYRDQVVLGPGAEWPANDIQRLRDRGMFVSEIAHRDGQGFVVVMSAASSGRTPRQQFFRGWAQEEIVAKILEGFNLVQALKVADNWYVVLTEASDQGTYEFNQMEFPRTGVLRLASQGYRVAWLR